MPEKLIVHPYFGFSLRHQMAPQQTTKNSEPHVLVNFVALKRKDSVANYRSIWTHFSPSVRGLDVLYNALNIS